MSHWLLQNRIKIILVFVILLLIILWPLFIKNAYILHLLIMIMLWGVCAASWDLVFGYMGIFHFAQIAFLGIGAYASALLTNNLGISPWIGIFFGGVVAGCFGGGLAFPTLRLKETYLTLMSLGFVYAIFYLTSAWTSFTRGENGFWGIEPLISGSGKIGFYYTMCVLFVFSMSFLYLIVNSKYGLALVAIKESENSAKSLGVKTMKIKVLVFMVSAALTGIMGGFYAHYLLFLSPDILGLDPMVDLVAMAVIGGTGSLFGPVIGAFLLTLLLEYFRIIGEYRFLIYAGALIFIMMSRPRGIYAEVKKLIEKYEKKPSTL